MQYIEIHVMDAIPFMLAKTANMLPLEIRSIKKKDPPVGQHLVECCGTAHNTYWEILDTCRGVKKLMTKEVIDIKKLKRHLIRLDEYREGGGGN